VRFKLAAAAARAGEKERSVGENDHGARLELYRGWEDLTRGQSRPNRD